MAMLWSNNASTTVAGAIAATDTTVTLNSLEFFPGNPPNTPPINTGDYFVATFYDQQTKTLNEIVHVTGVSGNTATIVRGQEGTTPLAWSAGDIFANLITAGTLDNFVQKGAVPIDTSIVYVGDDTSTNPLHIVCNTVPVPANFSVGMLFNIRVGTQWAAGVNANLPATDLQLNGKPVVLAKRTDGSNLVGGELRRGQDYIFIYNGAAFDTTMMPVPQQPPQYTFYVRSDAASTVNSSGIESASGFANTVQDAFRTIQGAINTIKARYISSLAITIRVADGVYQSGFGDNTQYIASWNIVGNRSQPQNCQIICTSVSPSTYVPYAPVAVCVALGQVSVMTVAGFSFQSYNQNALIDGLLELWDCHFTAPTSGLPCVDSAGTARIYGYCTLSAANAFSQFACAHAGGQVGLGYYDGIFTPIGFNMTINGTPNVTQGFVSGFETGTISIYDNVCAFTGQCHGYQYICSTGGGIGFYTGNTGILPADTPGIVTTASPGDCGGWITHG
jgi:hypothetical protein